MCLQCDDPGEAWDGTFPGEIAKTWRAPGHVLFWYPVKSARLLLPLSIDVNGPFSYIFSQATIWAQVKSRPYPGGGVTVKY